MTHLAVTMTLKVKITNKFDIKDSFVYEFH